ncbi:MAG TPA: DUF167 family protein [Hyphomicrobiaceae bacterium]|nr:DUF167 family protein [Hyphomicrobiaceae bacterium]
MRASADLWRKGKHGIELRARVIPRSSKDAVEGIEATADGAALKLRVRAVPDQGKANRAVERVIAEWLGVPKTSISVSAGTASRNKTVSVAESDGIEAIIRKRIAELSGA